MFLNFYCSINKCRKRKFPFSTSLERVRQNTDHSGGGKILDFDFDHLIRKPIKSYLGNQNINSFWLIHKKITGTPFFQLLGSYPKNPFFQSWSYFAIFFSIVWRFEAWNIQNDREWNSLQNSLFLLFYECNFLWERNQVWKK